MKKILFALLLLPLLSNAAPLTEDQAKAMVEDLNDASRQCSGRKKPDGKLSQPCEVAQELEKEVFKGGWCYSAATNKYSPCEPGLADFLDDVFQRRKTVHREVMYSYTIQTFRIGEMRPISDFPYRFYPERPCTLPLDNAKNMAYMERSDGRTFLFKGCYWPVLGGSIAMVYMINGQPNFESFPNFTLMVAKIGKTGEAAMVVDWVVTRKQMRESTGTSY